MKEAFIKYIAKEKRYSPHTVKSYQSDLTQLQNFLSQQYCTQNFSDINHHIIRSWLVSLIEQGISPTSINRKISCLKSFFKFLHKEQAIVDNPMLKIISPKSSKKLPGFIKEIEMQQLLNDTDFGEGFENVRNKTIIETFYLTGIRVSELIQIKETDLNKIQNVIKIIGKRNKERFVPLSQRLIATINNYLIIKEQNFYEDGKRSDFLFVTTKGEQMYSKLVYRLINKYLTYVSTNSKKSPHTLRHSFATVMLNNGAELNTIKEILGHANLAATQVYTHISMGKIKSIYKHAHPRA